ncbi:hypothetical protein ANACOL_03739 [Anaerotruncus colihominis DSM 17241]|uniref:Uncharacterized protein n=1 Tax=Anaerotruncus colihominis DSM 17241 TaxID=445972 RepID=B0PG07_9FIRM|nr:hypothetical protein ANACOL_03739 [Anaerotruncus colihominis DSM 17241]
MSPCGKFSCRATARLQKFALAWPPSSVRHPSAVMQVPSAFFQKTEISRTGCVIHD